MNEGDANLKKGHCYKLTITVVSSFHSFVLFLPCYYIFYKSYIHYPSRTFVNGHSQIIIFTRVNFYVLTLFIITPPSLGGLPRPLLIWSDGIKNECLRTEIGSNQKNERESRWYGLVERKNTDALDATKVDKDRAKG